MYVCCCVFGARMDIQSLCFTYGYRGGKKHVFMQHSNAKRPISGSILFRHSASDFVFDNTRQTMCVFPPQGTNPLPSCPVGSSSLSRRYGACVRQHVCMPLCVCVCMCVFLTHLCVLGCVYTYLCTTTCYFPAASLSFDPNTHPIPSA